MAKKTKEEKEQYVEVVVPFGADLSDLGLDGLFDDCSICQQMRRDLEAGKIERVNLDKSPKGESGFRSL